ncbi:DUF6958 family protein [Primorskyibacter sp. S187A]|uniref:DUF6958 family protein n=1 Tax=Primorskyibacter sp. S187A TaxID=3415130 RepID=UPI003C7981A0
MTADKVACRTPAEGKDGVTNIPVWKFELLRAAILAELGKGTIAFSALRTRLSKGIAKADHDRLGSLGWHTTVVRHAMGWRGEGIRRLGVSPQVITQGWKAPCS